MMTLSGLRMLWQMRKKSEQLPERWSIQAKKYLLIKRKVCQKFKRPWDFEQLKEAENIVRDLYA